MNVTSANAEYNTIVLSDQIFKRLSWFSMNILRACEHSKKSKEVRNMKALQEQSSKPLALLKSLCSL